MKEQAVKIGRPKNQDMPKALLVRLPESVRESLRELSFCGGQTMQSIILQALLDWNLHEKAQKALKDRMRRA